MKKILTVLSALAVLMSAAVFTGCQEGDDIIKELAGPTQTWCDMPVQYKNTDGGSAANIYVYFYYTGTDYTSSSTGGSALKNGKTIPAGITMVVTARADVSSIIPGLKADTYIMKTFPLDSAVAADDGDTSFQFKGSREKWSALYWAKSDLRQKDHQSANPPSVLSNSSYQEPLSWASVKDSFSWKRLLGNYLLSD